MYKKNAFTLLELSIVLIVIGLLTAAVTVGTDIIEQSRLKDTMSKIQNLDSAFVVFESRYDQLPGDFNDMTSFDSGNCVDDGANTCNGNNDRQLLSEPANTTPNEGWRALQHLSLLFLIQGEYTGIDNASNSGKHILNENVMAMPFDIAGLIPTTDAAQGFTAFLVGSLANSDVNLTGPALTARNTVFLDTKLDDGNFDTGFIRAQRGANLADGCINAGNTDYELDQKVNLPTCSMYWIFADN